MAQVIIRYTYGEIGYKVTFDTVTKDVATVQDSNLPAPGELVVSGEPAIGQYLYSKCDGTTLDRLQFQGSNFVDYLPEADSPTCGYTPPADGTFIRVACYGVDQYHVVADGAGGERQGALVKANAAECGYIGPPVRGCTNPYATNYDLRASEDDGTCEFPPAAYHAAGGVLPNPIEYPVAVQPLTGEGLAKQNHFILATIHRLDNSMIGSLKARVRDGIATLDVSSYLRPLVKTSMATTYDPVSVQEGAVVGFYVSYSETYTGAEQMPVVQTPPAYAVEAALDHLNGTLDAYLLR